jgi:phosphoribosyl-dephospho-CoA transferase
MSQTSPLNWLIPFIFSRKGLEKPTRQNILFDHVQMPCARTQRHRHTPIHRVVEHILLVADLFNGRLLLI